MHIKYQSFLFYGVLVLSIIFILIPILKHNFLFNILQNIGFSVLAAYIFYFITFYIPQTIKQKQATKILHTPMFNIVLYMKYIIAIFNKYIKITEDNCIICQNDFIKSETATIYFKINNLLYKENISFFIKHSAQLLKKSMDKVINNRCFHNLNDETIDNILRLQSSEFFKHITSDFTLKTDDDIRYGDLCKEYNEFITIYMFLSKSKEIPTAQELTSQEKTHYDSTIELITLSSHSIPKSIAIILNNVCYIPK